MADLKPIGSEKLEGTDKLKRIMEIANYGRTSSQEINESTGSVDYTIQLADGNFYGIVKEKNGYIVKKGINESELEYSEPMKNRKYYSSYSQAMKKVNLIFSRMPEKCDPYIYYHRVRPFIFGTKDNMRKEWFQYNEKMRKEYENNNDEWEDEFWNDYIYGTFEENEIIYHVADDWKQHFDLFGRPF